jgi:CubicO group peptidase (beta-lactamase class C family)
LPDDSGVPINGSCARGFERVRDAFKSNFTDRDDIGAAVAVWVEGDLIVNLSGGFADAAGLRPWGEDTLASIYSGTKGADQHLRPSAGRPR